MKFQNNISGTGRAVRGLLGLGSAFGAVALGSRSTVLTTFLSLVAVFLVFEAARGWCALRACKIRTPF